MCCPFIVTLVIGVSNKAYTDSCGCLWNEPDVTPSHKQLQGQNHESIWSCSGCKVCGSCLFLQRFPCVPSTDLCVCALCRLLQDHNGVQSRSDCSAVCRLFHGPLPAHRRESSSDRRYTTTPVHTKDSVSTFASTMKVHIEKLDNSCVTNRTQFSLVLL